MKLSSDSLTGKLDGILFSLKSIVSRDNRTAAAALDSMKVFKLCCKVHRPNISQYRCRFEDLGLLGNNPTDWILGRQHRWLSKPFFNIYAAADGLPFDNEILMLLSSLVLRLMTVASFSEFEVASTINGVVITRGDS